MNLRGGRAMSVPEFIKYRERTVIGASLTVIVPTGQYDPARLINPGAHRVGFKPELGLTRRLGRWAWDGYGGLWVFTENSSFFPGNSVRKQNMITSLEFHLGYYLRPRAWVSFDSNFWVGGNTVVNGVENQDRARNSRLGGTISMPLSRHNSLKFSASTGAIVRVGGNFTTYYGRVAVLLADKAEVGRLATRGLDYAARFRFFGRNRVEPQEVLTRWSRRLRVRDERSEARTATLFRAIGKSNCRKVIRTAFLQVVARAADRRTASAPVCSRHGELRDREYRAGSDDDLPRSERARMSRPRISEELHSRYILGYAPPA